MNELQVIEKALKGAKCRKAEIDFPIDEVIVKAQEIAEKYRHAIYTDEMVKTCKGDRATLNKIAKKIDSTALNIDKELSAPIKRFRDEMKKASGIIKEAASVVQFKADEFEEKRKKELEENINLAVARVKEQSELDQKYLDRIETKKNYHNVAMTINKITKDLEAQVVVLKAEQDLERSKYNLIDTKVELYNLKLGLQIGVTAKSLYYLVEMDTLEEIDEKVLELVTDQKVVEDQNIARLEREAKEKAEREKQAELDKKEEEHRLELERIESEKKAEIKKQVEEQTKEVTEKAEETIKTSEIIADSVADFIPVETGAREKIYTFTIELKATVIQKDALKKYLEASSIEYKAVL